MHPVEREFQSGDTGPLAFALLELDQEFVGVRRDSPQLVQLGVVACRNDIAVADERRRFGCDRPGEKVANIDMLLYSSTQLQQQWRVAAFESRAQRGNGTH